MNHARRLILPQNHVNPRQRATEIQRARDEKGASATYWRTARLPPAPDVESKKEFGRNGLRPIATHLPVLNLSVHLGLLVSWSLGLVVLSSCRQQSRLTYRVITGDKVTRTLARGIGARGIPCSVAVLAGFGRFWQVSKKFQKPAKPAIWIWSEWWADSRQFLARQSGIVEPFKCHLLSPFVTFCHFLAPNDTAFRRAPAGDIFRNFKEPGCVSTHILHEPFSPRRGPCDGRRVPLHRSVRRRPTGAAPPRRLTIKIITFRARNFNRNFENRLDELAKLPMGAWRGANGDR